MILDKIPNLAAAAHPRKETIAEPVPEEVPKSGGKPPEKRLSRSN